MSHIEIQTVIGFYICDQAHLLMWQIPVSTVQIRHLTVCRYKKTQFKVCLLCADSLNAGLQCKISTPHFLSNARLTCDPSSTFSSLCYISATRSLETQTIVPFLPYPFHKLNSSSYLNPFTKRSERILEFHQLLSPLDTSLMSWRAHT